MVENSNLSLGQLVSLSCILEATIPKPGNVHRGADFADASLIDFLASAVAIANVFDRVNKLGVGAIVLESVRQTRQLTDTNTNLGLIMLLAPLAKATCRLQNRSELNQSSVAETLREMNDQDTADFYQAIRLAKPGGLGEVQQFDVNNTAAKALPTRLLDAMKIASSYDTIALQYTNNFSTVFDEGLVFLSAKLSERMSLTDAVILTHVYLMANFPDTLIARKCGKELAQDSATRAQRVLAIRAHEGDTAYLAALKDMDFWLRSDGNRRNPGTTADLIGATIFVGLLRGIVQPPFH